MKKEDIKVKSIGRDLRPHVVSVNARMVYRLRHENTPVQLDKMGEVGIIILPDG